MPINHFKITQALCVAALTFIVGQLCAFIPSLGDDKQILISAGSTLIAVAFLLANSIHASASSKVTAAKALAPQSLPVVKQPPAGPPAPAV
jgi:hypothetical protein